MKQYSLFILLFFCIYHLGKTQSIASVEKVRIIQLGDSLEIYYDILGAAPDERFQVWLKMFKPNDEEIPFSNGSGAIGSNLTGGNGKKITVGLPKSFTGLTTSLYAEVFIRSNIALKPGGASFFTPEKLKSIAKTLILPGWGKSTPQGREKYWLMGVGGYAAIAGSVYFHQRAKTRYQDYIEASSIAERSDHYAIAERSKKTAQALSYVAAGIWVGNLIWVSLGSESKEKTKNIELKPSREGLGAALNIHFNH